MDPKLEGWVGNGSSVSIGVTAGAPEADPCPRPQIKRRNAGLQSSLGALGPGLQFPSETAIHWLPPNTPGSTTPLLPQGWGWGAVS